MSIFFPAKEKSQEKEEQKAITQGEKLEENAITNEEKEEENTITNEKKEELGSALGMRREEGPSIEEEHTQVAAKEKTPVKLKLDFASLPPPPPPPPPPSD